jgi:hypothetical protein
MGYGWGWRPYASRLHGGSKLTGPPSRAGRSSARSAERPSARTSSATATAQIACRAGVFMCWNGSLHIAPGEVQALVSGSNIHKVTVSSVKAVRWRSIFGGEHKRGLRPLRLNLFHLLEALCRHTRPGNVRELQNLMKRAVLLSPGPNYKCRCQISLLLSR